MVNTSGCLPWCGSGMAEVSKFNQKCEKAGEKCELSISPRSREIWLTRWSGVSL